MMTIKYNKISEHLNQFRKYNNKNKSTLPKHVLIHSSTNFKKNVIKTPY